MTKRKDRLDEAGVSTADVVATRVIFHDMLADECAASMTSDPAQFEGMSLDEAKERRIAQLQQCAEMQMWAAFVSHPFDVPNMAMAFVLAGAALGGNLLTKNRDELQAARQAVSKMRQKCDLVNAATAISDVPGSVASITWLSTP